MKPISFNKTIKKPVARRVLYGYRANEVDLKIPCPPDSTRYALNKNYHSYDATYRPPMAACFNLSVPAIPPRPDTTNPNSSLTGIAKRMGYSPPRYNRNLRRRFRKFVRNWLKKNMTPLDSTETFDVKEWLDSSSYPEWRKQEILNSIPEECYINGEIDLDHLTRVSKGKKIFEIKMFVKEEYYPEYKHFRGIWARSDAAKTVMGPFFRKIEKQLFALPYFIKKIPKNERPQYINDFMNSNLLEFQGTDYTSFESQFTTDMMDDCEFELYRYMSAYNPKAQLLCRLIFQIIATSNVASSKYFKVKVDAKRMSGEMNTSLGNGFSNLMFLLFACELYEITYSGPIIEGDDALIGLSKRIPLEYYTAMGLNVKMENVNDISEGSFCGLIYDSQELVNIRDPREPLSTTSWVTRKYASSSKTTYFELVRSKSLSLMYEYPGCPIVYNYGKKIFNLLSEYKIRVDFDSTYSYEKAIAAHKAYVNNSIPQKETGPRTRLLMEKMFNIPVSLQYRIESEIEQMTIDNFNLPSVMQIMPDCWKQNYDNYVVETGLQTEYSVTHPPRLVYPPLAVDTIIKMPKNRLDANIMLTKKEYLTGKLKPTDAMYADYVERYRDARSRISNNNDQLSQTGYSKNI